MSLILDEHRQYLADEARLAAFREAIAEVVKPGDVVLDLGCGTGILGLLACRAGAKRVYAVDEGGMIQVAREVCQANGFQDRIVHIKGLSARVDLPEQVDVVVADQIGRFGFDAGIFEYYADAKERFLKPEGRTIPVRLDLCVAPVEHEAMWKQVEFWSGKPAGFDFGPVGPLAANTGYPARYGAQHLLGEPAVIASLDPASSPASILNLEAAVSLDRDGMLHGVGGWFSARLSDRVTMSNGPLARHPINRQSVYFPLTHPAPAAKGDEVRIRMNLLPADSLVTWTVELRGGGTPGRPDGIKASESHSTFQGMLLSQEDLRKTGPSFLPKLTVWGEARLSVLQLCDGRKPLAEVEKEVYRRHARLFRSPAEASKFVAEVVSPYAL